MLPTRDALHEAFLWSEQRTVTKTATVSLNSNTYEVDAALVGHRVELVFDPFDLTDIAVRYQGRAMGPAIPHRIGRHVHRKARPDIDPPPPAPTGIDYLHLIETAHTAELAQRLRYDQLGDQHDNDQHTDQHDVRRPGPGRRRAGGRAGRVRSPAPPRRAAPRPTRPHRLPRTRRTRRTPRCDGAERAS